MTPGDAGLGSNGKASAGEWPAFGMLAAPIAGLGRAARTSRRVSGPRHPGKRSLGQLIAVGTALLILALAAGTALFVARTRQTAMQAAEIGLQNSALVVESTINRQFLQVDQVLASLPAILASAIEPTGQVDGAAASRLLRGLNFQTFVFRDVMLLRPDGGVWARARPNLQGRPPPLGMQELATTAHPGSVIVAGPVRNPLTGDWVLYLSRPVTIAGAGLMYAVAEVPVPLLAELLSPVGVVHGQRVSVERTDGQLLAGQPNDELLIGRRHEPVMAAGRANGVAFRLPPADGRGEMIEVFRHTLYGDVLVSVSLDLRTALRDWQRDRNRLVVAVGVASVLIVALAAALFAALRQRERTEAERAHARAVLDSAIESMSDGFVMWDAEDRLVACNRQYREMYRISAPFIRPGARFEDIIRQGALLGQYPQAGADIEGFVRDITSWHRAENPPMERELPDGRWVLITERRTPDGGTVGIRTDITAMKTASAGLLAANDRATRAMQEVKLQNEVLLEQDRALRKQNLLFDAALNNMSQGLLMSDSRQELIVCNHRFLALFGVESRTIIPGMNISDVFDAIEHAGHVDVEVVRTVVCEQELLTIARSSGTFVAASVAGRALAVSQQPLADGGWVATYEDVTEQRRAEERIRFTAHHDALTKLPNRLLFRMRLEEALRTMSVGSGQGLALLYLDLDKFKDVNDTLGHPVGDALLEAAAQRLAACLREGDVVARLGGDEFAILYIAAELPRAARQLGDRIIESLSAPYELAGHNVVVGASVGIAVVQSGALTSETDPDTLLKNADLALYQAKAKGRGTCCLFEAEMEAQLHARLAIEEDLRGALDGQELEVLYQPLFDLRSNRVCGFEALLRWNHPTRGIVMPMQFIHLAEEIGLIDGIGAWVLRRACDDAMEMPNDVKVAVNLSPAQLRNDNIVEIVAGALHASGLHPSRLELEITETALLKDGEMTLALLLRLRQLGIRIALDDFGTGYSSLSYVRNFPFDKIKIDKSFVREMSSRHDSAAIVSSVVGLANKLHMMTTAEGIETIDQLNLVRELDCSEAQGYLFGVPRPIGDVLDFFAESAPSATLAAQ